MVATQATTAMIPRTGESNAGSSVWSHPVGVVSSSTTQYQPLPALKLHALHGVP